MKIILSSLFFLSFIFSNSDQESVVRNFIASGKLDGMVSSSSQDLKLIQLDLKNDSLFQIVDNAFPDLELFNGPASYHRIIPDIGLQQIKELLDLDYLTVISENYNPPDDSRLYWTETKQGGATYGTYTEDEGIEYTCACIGDQTSDCVKLGYDESWYNPFDYYGEAWWDFEPPYYDYIQEIRVTVRGTQCDALPVWSETYMGLKDNNGNWSNDYELSINYADNIFIVPATFNQGILMPAVGSEDNYVIDFVRFDFFYSCIDAQEAIQISASDQDDCSIVEINWELDPSSAIDGVRLYKDQNLIFESNDLNETSFIDYSAENNISHEYCIETLNGCSSSDWICDSGSLYSTPDSVSYVDAMDGEQLNEVLVQWNPVNDTEGYRIYRDDVWLGLVFPHQDLEYLDIYTSPGTIYNYCIESYNNCGNSNWVCDSGFSGAYLGDANFDGNIDVLDVVTLVNFILLINSPTDDQAFWLDMNQDNLLNVQDIVLIVNIILD